MAFQMNKQRARHMGSEDSERNHGQPMPHIHIHSHSQGHTVHVMHHDGTHEKFEHSHGDAEGMAEHVHNYLGNGEQRPENDMGAGGADGASDGLGV